MRIVINDETDFQQFLISEKQPLVFVTLKASDQLEDPKEPLKRTIFIIYQSLAKSAMNVPVQFLEKIAEVKDYTNELAVAAANKEATDKLEEIVKKLREGKYAAFKGVIVE
jgi:hypothetical protein